LDGNEEEKTEIFATYLCRVFKANPREITLEEENKLLSDDITSLMLNISTKLYYQWNENRNKISEFKKDAGLRPHNQYIAETARNGM